MKNLPFAAAFWLLFAACASITSPNGGPKDIYPPELMSTNPKPNQLNFKGKSIELEFDEAIKLKTPKEEIIISPRPGKDVEFKAVGKKVTITPKLGWLDSTTYSVQFREGIQDLTESNVPPNLKLAFSTGPTIDSLLIGGTVTEILKGTEQEKITVALYQQDTFDIFTDQPGYFTQTDTAGRFHLTNIKEGIYRLYAFDDKNKNLKVESRNERFAFLADSLQLNQSIDSIQLGLIRVDSRLLKINTIRNTGSITRLRFNKYILTYSVKAEKDIVHSFAGSQEEILFWSPPGDSIQLTLSATDSIGSTADSTFFIKKTNTRTITETFKWSLGKPVVAPETGKFSTTLSFNKPIDNINFDSLFIEIGTVNTVPISRSDISIDTTDNQIIIARQISKAFFKGEKPPLINLKAGDSTTTLSFNKPLKNLNLDSLFIEIDTVSTIPIRRSDISIDSTQNQIIIAKEINKAIFKAEKSPLINLKAGAGFVHTVDSDTSKRLSTNVGILKSEDTGSLLVEISTTSSNHILQLTTSDGKVIASIPKVRKHTFKALAPGEYQLRVIIDSNQNGKWDPGNIYKRLEPEKVIFYRGPKRKLSFPVRSNWELGPLQIRF